MEKSKIAIIGGGNLGSSIAAGILKTPEIDNSDVTITRRRTEMLDFLFGEGMKVSSDNIQAVKDAEFVFLVVKPKIIEKICQEISPVLDESRHIIVSMVTGVSSEKIAEYLGKNLPVFRAMPNTAIAIRESMTCITTYNTTKEQEKRVTGLFNLLGKSEIIPEDLMSAATVLGACGTAFALRFIRAVTQGGVEIGFGSELALKIAGQMVKGAAELVDQTGHHPEREIDKVTTPMGITISGLNEMEHNGFSSALIKGLVTSYNKIENGKK